MNGLYDVASSLKSHAFETELRQNHETVLESDVRHRFLHPYVLDGRRADDHHAPGQTK